MNGSSGDDCSIISRLLSAELPRDAEIDATE